MANKKYKITLTEKQMRITQVALEEYFRLRMGQDLDFSEDMAAINHDLSAENPNHKTIFSEYISRRDHLREIMRAYFRIAFEPSGYLSEQTDEMLNAQCIWDAIRTARGCNRGGQAMQMGGVPLPETKVLYMRQQQVKWVAPQIMACLLIAMHRKKGFGFERCQRLYQQVQEIIGDYDQNADRIRKACLEETKVNITDILEREQE